MVKLKDDLLVVMSEELQLAINQGLESAETTSKTCEISLKIKIRIEERNRYEKFKVVDTWDEPVIEYEVKKKLKEVASTSKGYCPLNQFKIEKDEDGNLVVIEVGQMGIDDLLGKDDS
jgi:hypothetical protein